MEAEGTVQLSHEPTACLCSDLYKFRLLPHCISRIFILIVLPCTLTYIQMFFLSGFPFKILQTFLFSPIRDTVLAYLIFLDLITSKIFGEGKKSRNSSLCFFFSPIFLTSSSAKISLRTLFSKSDSLCPSLNIRNYHKKTPCP